MQPTIRSFDLAHLAHVELLTPKPEESLRFFVDVMGMTESGRRGDSVYLRGWDDYEHHTLKLTAAKIAGMGHFAYRATSPEALQHGAWPSSRSRAAARAGPTAISATGRPTPSPRPTGTTWRSTTRPNGTSRRRS